MAGLGLVLRRLSMDDERSRFSAPLCPQLAQENTPYIKDYFNLLHRSTQKDSSGLPIIGES